MTRLAPDGAEWAGTVKGSQETVFYRCVRPGNYQFAYKGDPWVDQKGSPMCVPLIPFQEWQASNDERLAALSAQACQLIEKDVEKWNINIDCSAAMRAVVDAMIKAGYRK